MTRRPSITSAANPRLKRLRRLARRRVRDAEGVFVAEGHRQLRAALEANAVVRAVYAAPALFLGARDELLVRDAERRGGEVFAVGADAYRAVATNARPDGLLAVVARWETGLGALALRRTPLVVVADGVERPGNLGAVVRTACAAGADAVVATDAATDVFHPDAVHGSVGALFHVRLAEARRDDAAAALRARGIRVVVASPYAERPYWDADFRGPVAVVVGSERHGVAEQWLDAADDAVRIPMSDGADSLNVAVAAGVVLFEAARQRAEAERGRARATRAVRPRKRRSYSATYSRSR